jgi:hypothetical protein
MMKPAISRNDISLEERLRPALHIRPPKVVIELVEISPAFLHVQTVYPIWYNDNDPEIFSRNLMAKIVYFSSNFESLMVIWLVHGLTG